MIGNAIKAGGPSAARGIDEDFAILDLIDECVIRLDFTGMVLTWNLGAERLYGWSAAEAIGRRFDDLTALDPSPLAGLPPGFVEAGRWEGEIVRRTREGDRVHVAVSWILRRDETGAPCEIIGIDCDITARKRMEQQLQISDERYRDLFQAMSAALWELDFSEVGDLLRKLSASGVSDYAAYLAAHPQTVRALMRATRVIDVNEHAVVLFGGTGKADILGSVEPFWPEESSDVFAASVIAAIAGQSVYSTETVLQARDGRRFDVLFTACLPPDGVARGLLLIGVIDISPRVRALKALEASEARYRHVIQHLPISLLQLDMTGLGGLLKAAKARGQNLLDYVGEDPTVIDELIDAVVIEEGNEGAARMFGAPNAEALRGRSIAFAWNTRPETLRRSLLARFSGLSSYAEETRIDTLDGRTLDVLYTIAFPPALLDRGMNVVGFLDITDRVQAQSALMQVEAELAHASRVAMLGELTASIAHEVNQPLAAIAANADAGLRWLAQPEPDLAELRDITVSIAQDARRAADVILRVRGMAMRSAPSREMVDLNEVVGEAVAFISHETGLKDIAVQLHLAAERPVVHGDRIQLQQVVVNLAMNAVQALEKEMNTRRRLSIETRTTPDGSIMVAVEDNGPGLPSAIRDHVFETFFTTKPRGMGLGLPICRSIIEAHGGQLELAEAAGGRGGRLVFNLPPASARPQAGLSAAAPDRLEKPDQPLV